MTDAPAPAAPIAAEAFEPGEHFRVRRLLLPVVALAVLFIVTVSAALYLIGRDVDLRATADAKEVAASAINAFQRHLRRVATDFASSDLAARNLLVAFEPGWAYERLGRYLAEVHGVATVVLLDREGRRLFAVADGVAEDDFDLDRLGPGFRELVAAARAQPDQFPPVAVSGFVWRDAELHIASAARIAPRDPELAADPRVQGAVLALTRPFAGSVRSQLEEDYNLGPVALAAPGGGQLDGTLPLRDAAGASLAELDWSIALPGRRIWRTALPAIALACLAGAAALGFFGVQARRTVERIENGRIAVAASNAALSRSEGYLKAVLDQAADGIVATDSDGVIRSANRAAEGIFAYPPGGLLGVSLTALFPALAPPFAVVGDGARPRAAAVRRDGARLNVELAVNALRHGADSGYVAVMADATERRGALETLDLLPAAVLILDSERRIMLANEGARRLIAQQDGLLLEGERISAWRQEDRDALALAVQEATAPGAEPPRPGFVRVARRSGKPPLALLVTPPTGEPGSETAVVFVRSMDLEAEVPAQLLGDLFHLTPAEARVTAELVRGRTPQEIADAASVSLNTIRNQLQQAYRKAGVSRQSELVAVVLSAAAFVSAA